MAPANRDHAFDLHVLSMPPAFVLSQDQTLMFNPGESLKSTDPGTSEQDAPIRWIAKSTDPDRPRHVATTDPARYKGHQTLEPRCNPNPQTRAQRQNRTASARTS